ncbi:hypothetical protein NDA10_006936 [Ustilago hordei]|nr:hypothetical protein NDA10_006936 [Ustilago hordei]UTT90692.1 hypothetical protein NDA17_005511 [Ustilago hordei]
MPPASSVGSSRRKHGQPTVCLECYLRKVKCDRKRPCSTCIRRCTQHLCKTFNTSQLDPQTLQKKQARRSLAEINALLHESSSDGHGDDADPQQPSMYHQQPEHPMMAFINLMLKDLNVQDDPQLDSQASSETASSSAGSPTTSYSAVARYMESGCLTKMVDFCQILPDWSQLQALLQHYLWHVDWKLLITNQDLLEAQTKDLWDRVILPSQSFEAHVAASSSSAGIAIQQGDLSRLALLASVIGETIETLSPDTIVALFPITLQLFANELIKLGVDSSPRVKALSLITHHIHALIDECVRLDEMTIELVQANLSSFSLWSNQGLHGAGSAELPRWNVTIRAAQACKLFEDPSSNTSFSLVELDHRRRLAWLVYGYDHAFAIGANTKPLIVDSQFSVDQPSDAPPWSSSGAPPDASLAFLEVQGGKIAQLVSSTLCYGPPLHRKAMETDKQITDTLSQVHASYNWDKPDLSFDSIDPFRAQRRCWVQLTTAWQRESLHRQFFFPNGRITNAELATSRHIATNSALRSIAAVRELRKMQNRFSDRMGSAWWYQYFTEPCMTLATAALLLIRSKGQGVPGLSDQWNCWPRVMHYTQIIDECLQDVQASISEPSLCLSTLLTFGTGCIRLIQQLRRAVQTSLEALVKWQSGSDALKSLSIDQDILSLLHPRSRDGSSGSQFAKLTVDSTSGGGGSSGGSYKPTKQGLKRGGEATQPSTSSRSRKSIDQFSLASLDASAKLTVPADSLSVSPRPSAEMSAQTGEILPTTVPPRMVTASSFSAAGAGRLKNMHSIASVSPQHSSPDTSISALSSGTLSLTLGPQRGFPGCTSQGMNNPSTAGPFLLSERQQQNQLQQVPLNVAAPYYTLNPPSIPEPQQLVSTVPSALPGLYSSESIQRANMEQGISQCFDSVQMKMVEPSPAR